MEWAGSLSERVRFERRADVRAIAGNRTGDWQLAFECWAGVEQVARAERSSLAGETRHSARRWKIFLRRGVNPQLDMRVMWRGMSMVLTGIDEELGAGGRMIVWAEDANL